MKDRRDTRPEIWICGVNPAREALRSHFVSVLEIVYSRDDARAKELLELARTRNIPARGETRQALSTLLGHAHHQGVALRVSDYPYVALEEHLERPAAQREPLLVLDSIQDPQNLGALIRSACFLGAKGLVLPKDRSAKITASVVKVAAGATAYLPVIMETNLARALDMLKNAGLWAVGLDAEGSRAVHEVDLTVPVCLVIGNEQKGLRPLVRRQCDLLVRIPAHGPVDSLNAAVAGAIALAEVQRQRRLK